MDHRLIGLPTTGVALDPRPIGAYVHAACQEARVTPAVMLAKQRRADVVAARHRWMVRAYQDGHTSTTIARAFRRDHTTVAYALRKARRGE